MHVPQRLQYMSVADTDTRVSVRLPASKNHVQVQVKQLTCYPAATVVFVRFGRCQCHSQAGTGDSVPQALCLSSMSSIFDP